MDWVLDKLWEGTPRLAVLCFLEAVAIPNVECVIFLMWDDP